MREHEIIQSVFEEATRQLQGALPTHVRTVRFAKGEIFEMSEQSIIDAWLKFSENTLMEQADIAFRPIRAEVQCMACFQKYHPEGGQINCPHCRSFGAKILKGEEFYLDSIG